MNRYALGNNVHRILKEKKLNQHDLCRMADVGYSSLSTWVSGTRTPNAWSLYKIAKALGVTVDELLKGIDDV